jgi:hypothetical protein
MLTGKVPFDSDTPAEVLHQHLKSPPPRVPSLAPDVPRALDELIDRMLAKRIEDRPQSAVEVGVTLKTLEEAVQVAHRRTTETAGPPTEAERPVYRRPADDSDALPTARGLPRWAIAVPTAIALFALVWGWSQRDEVAALRRVEAFWLQRLQSGDDGERVLAVQTLGQIGAAGEGTIDSLIGALRDPSPRVRAAAATALGELGADAKAASGVLLRLRQTDEWPDVRIAATEALQKITGQVE